MKKVLSVLMMTVFCLSTVLAFDIPKSPNPPRLVNDYIHLLSATDAQALENKLVEFNNKTSIQIAVVILDDLDNAEASDVAPEILHQWGVGQKGLDNGIVFLVVKYNQNAIEKLFTQKHGDWFITPGYGLEPYITDADVKQIGDTQFIPFAKEDKYYQGIDATVSTIITKLGDVGWQQRQEFEAKRKAEVAESLRKFGNGFLMFLLFAVVLIGSGIVIHRARKAYLKKEEIIRQRKLLKEDFLAKAERYKNLFNRITAFDSSTYPQWAKDKHEEIMTTINKEIDPEADQEREKFLTVLGNDLNPVRDSLSRFTKLTIRLERLIDNLDNIQSEIQKYHDEAPLQIQSTKDWLVSLNTKITDLTSKKYKVSEYLTQATSFQTKIDEMERILNSESNQDLMLFESATGLVKEISETIENLDTIVSNKTETDQIIKKLNLDFETLPTMIANVQPVLDELKANYPNTCWEEVDRNFRKVTNLSTTCNEFKKYAEEKGTMELQEFATAKSFADKAQKNMNSVHTYCADIQNKKAELLHAQKQFNTLLQSTQKKIDLAKNKITDTDVQKDAKTLYASAHSSLQEAISKKAEAKVDWIMVISCLTTASALADKAYTNAQTDITNAEQKRQDDANALKAAAAAALLAAANKRRKEEDDYNSSSNRSSSDNGFGGFGGGNGGGGGAGGSW